MSQLDLPAIPVGWPSPAEDVTPKPLHWVTDEAVHSCGGFLSVMIFGWSILMHLRMPNIGTMNGISIISYRYMLQYDLSIYLLVKHDTSLKNLVLSYHLLAQASPNTGRLSKPYTQPLRLATRSIWSDQLGWKTWQDLVPMGLKGCSTSNHYLSGLSQYCLYQPFIYGLQ